MVVLFSLLTLQLKPGQPG